MTICTRLFSDVVSSTDAAMEWATVASLDDLTKLRNIAKRYNVSVRRGANAQTIQRQIHAVMERMNGIEDAALAEFAMSDSSADLRQQSCTHDAAPTSQAYTEPAAQQRPPRGPLLGDACVHATAVDADSDHVTAQTAQGDTLAFCTVPQLSANAVIAPYLRRIASLEAEVLQLQLDVAAQRQAALQQECQPVMLVINVQQPELNSSSQEQQTAPEQHHAAQQQHAAPAPAAPSRQPTSSAAAPEAALPQQPAATNRPSTSSTDTQQQQRLSARSSSTVSTAWVFCGLDFAAGSSSDVAAAAIQEFCMSKLALHDAAQHVTVSRVSKQKTGLAVVSVNDGAFVRRMCSAKARLPSTCRVSIFESVAPQRRDAAAQLRRSQHQTAQAADAVADARRAAADAVVFVQQHLVPRRHRRPSALGPHPAAAPLGIASRFAVLPVEPTSHMPSGDPTPAEGSSPSPAKAPATPTPTPNHVC
jgi:hypothetical protein